MSHHFVAYLYHHSHAINNNACIVYREQFIYRYNLNNKGWDRVIGKHTNEVEQFHFNCLPICLLFLYIYQNHMVFV